MPLFMPPEPLPWDRKELGVKDRKHETGPDSDALGGGGVGGGGGGSSLTAPRWREPYQGPRGDYPRASPHRSVPGHYRQGSAYYQVYPEESGGGHGCTPSRSSEKSWPEDESFRNSSGRYSGGRSGSGGGGGSRETRVWIRRSPYWDSGDSSRRREFPSPVTGQRSVAVPVSPVSHLSSLPLLKNQHDKSSGGVDDGSGTGRSYERDHALGSVGWKPRKWTLPCSLSSSKATRTESDEVGVEVLVSAGKETPVRSPAMSPLLSDDGAPRKKQRLSWGQGLAKYEKKKVEGSSDTNRQSESVQCVSSVMSALDDTSPKLASVPGCTSPATRCSAVSSSSPGLEEKLCIRESNNDASLPNDSSGQGLQDCSEEFSIKFDLLDVTAISILTSQLAEWLQHEDACSGDSSFTRHTAMNKLLVLKEDISKELEKTEGSLDLLENELKALNGDGRNYPCQSSFSSQDTCSPGPCLRLAEVTLNMPLDSTQSKDNVLASPMALVGESPLHIDSLEEHEFDVKDYNDDCLGTVLPKYGKPASAEKGIFDFGTPELSGCSLDDGESLRTLGGHPEENCPDADSTGVYADHHMSPNAKLDNNLIDLFITSNMDAAKMVSEVLDKDFSIDHHQYAIWEPDYILSCSKNYAHVREKLAMHKRKCKFRERVIVLKFRALHHLWKEDLRLLLIRKNRPKSQKRLELCIRSSQSGFQRHRSSIRSRFTLPAGNLTLVPTTEIVDFTSKLLSDSQIKLYRKNLNMPSLILNEMERKYSSFISYNGFVEDPATFEKERAMVNPWTYEEKERFKDMLTTFGKNFTKISSFLAHKTTADCIEFYYKNHKSESFEDVRRQLNLRKQTQSSHPKDPKSEFLLTEKQKWNREVNAASLDMLGEASLVAAHSNGNTRNRQKHAGRSVSGSYNDLNVTRGNNVSLERTSSVDNISRHEREIVAADVLAGICGAVSSEAMSSCVTSSIGPTEKNHLIMDRPQTPEVAQHIYEEDTCSEEGCGEMESVDWTDDEKSLLIRALGMYGKDFARISRFIGTRSREQCKIFFSKARKCLGLDAVHPGQGLGDTLSDMNGGRSDTDDAFAPEMYSSSRSKLDADVTQYVGNTSSGVLLLAGNTPIYSETERSSEKYEVGGTNHEEVEGEIDKLTSVPNDDKLAKGGEIPKSDKFLEEKDDAVLRCNEIIQFHEERGDDHGSAPVNSTITTSIEAEKLKYHAAAEAQEDTGGNFPVHGLKGEVDSQQLMARESGFVSRQLTNADKDADTGASLCFAPDSNEHILTFAPKYQHHIPLELVSYVQKSRIQLKQEKSPNLPLNKVLPDPSSIFCEDLKHITAQSFLNFEGQGCKQLQKSVAGDFYHPRMIRNLSSNNIRQPLHILRGYPLQVLNQKEGKEITQPSQFLFPDMNSEKNSGLRLLSPQSGIQHPLKRENQLEAQFQPCSQSSCGEAEVQSHRTGDVKLFGQILSHPFSQQKSDLSSQECESQPLSSNSQKDGSASSRPGSSGQSVHSELPLRSYGFWDGSRIQTGLSSLPESAILVAKYQGSPAPGVPSSSGVVTDYQQVYVQPALAADGKRHDSFSELQKRNGFETVPGFQQQGRGILGVNMVGGGVSNPTSALKMHYVGRAKILPSEVEPWREDVRGK